MPILERVEPLRAVAGYLEEARAGHGRLTFVAGEAGIGKTTFVTQAIADAAGHAKVAIGACDGSATPAPLGPLTEMLAQLPAEVWPAGATRHTVFSLLVDALRAPKQIEPYLLVIEDAHWADEATLDLIRHLARRVDHCRALILVTYRPEDARPASGLRVLLGDTASAAGIRRIDLPPLSRAAVVELVADHARATPEAAPVDAAHLHDLTGGNAFFVTEVLSAGGSRAPATVRDAVMARVARLDESGQRALEVVALAGSRAETGLLEDLLRDGLTTFDEAIDRGLLRMNASHVTFRHELGRLAVADSVPAGRRIHLHRRLLAELRRRGADPARLAHHADAAGDSEAVLEFAPAAGARASSLGAHREAVDQYRRAVRHARTLGDERVPASSRAQLLWSLGYELYLTDRIEEAIDTVSQARLIWEATGDPVRVGDAWRCLSRLSWFAGRNDTAEDQARTAIEVLESTPSAAATVELALAYSNRAQLRMLASDLAGTREWGQRTLELVDELDDGAGRTEVRVHALNNLGTIELAVGDPDAGAALLLESLSGARRADLHEHAARAYCNLASTAVLQRRHDDADRYLVEGIDYCIDRDLDTWTLYLQGWKATHHLDRGEHEASRRMAETVLRRGDLASIGVIEPLVTLAQLTARLGEPDPERFTDRAAELAKDMREVQRIAPVIAARCEVAWVSGHPERAQEIATEAWPGIADADCTWNRGAIARWCVGIDDGGRPVAAPFAAESAGRWREAADLWGALGCPFESGLALARSGERDLITEATSIFERIGAHGAADRARALLRAHGWAAPRATRPSTRANPAGLTPREAEVLTLVEDGLTDAAIAARLFISSRTAEHHVAAILAKLGVSSRRDLGGRLGRYPVTDG